MTYNSIHTFLNNIERDFGIMPIEMERASHYLLQIDPLLDPCHLYLTGDTFSLFAQIAPLTLFTKKEDLYLFLLKANFLGKGTRDCALGINAEESHVTLRFTMHNEIDYEIFKQSLEEFLNMQNYWSDKLKSFDSKHV